MTEKCRPSRTHSASTRLKHQIDSGNTGDKVNYPDLAAAPLGTDEEAAGTPSLITDKDIEAELRRPPKPQRRRIPESVGERSVLIIVLIFALSLIFVVASIMSGANV